MHLADVAGVGLLPRVDALVYQQMAALRELRLTLVAVEGLLAPVPPHVHLGETIFK